MWRRLLIAVVALAALMSGCMDESEGGGGEFLLKAAEITDLHAQAKWAEIRRDFDEEMREGLTEEMLADGWTQLTSELGAYESRGQPRVVREANGLTVIDTPMFFEGGEYKSRVTFREDGQIAGLFILKKNVA